MRGDPAVETAAVALLCGMDPIRLARLDGPERLLHLAVVARAAEVRAEEAQAMAKAIGAHAGNRVGEILSKFFGS